MGARSHSPVDDLHFRTALRRLNEAHTTSATATLSAREALTILAAFSEAATALRDAGKAALTVKPTLTNPYPDQPDQTPWSRFMCAPSRRAYNLGHAIRRVMKGVRSPDA